MLIGHQDQERTFLAAWRSGQMHHAWLLTGPRGIGKSQFARSAASFLLARGAGEGRARDKPGEAERLETDPDGHTAHLIAAGSHPDLRTLERLPRERDERLAANIVLDQVRELQPMLQSTPSMSAWRAIVIDAADDLNRPAANALLKNLEEPPASTVFLLVSHAPGRLLPTVRSRCRTLQFRPLPASAVRNAIAARVEDASEADLDALVRMSEGAPGRALRLADAGGAELIRSLDGIYRDGSKGLGDAARLARSLATKEAQPRFEALLDLVPAYISQVAREAPGARLAAVVALWEKAHELGAQALPLSLDPQAVALELLSLVSALRQDEDVQAS